ncbi:AraC family transcriptional regulator [Paenibacillus psychroresistens]|uniref:AraC family transcriptional regulator n=1 Tax=Paenibacillus psychroresistens TaxID=1778678 RepID=A0A6B8RXY6_9BACL|nr:helix-turn-helix domain-containing protein [Paenibacillus psychroresistens]QGQ99858.1 AraC family transcriptional regulator [Paenibacillus psychroresistens]
MGGLRFFDNKNSNRLYFKTFIPIILSIIATLFISTSILYVNFEKISLNQVYEHDLDSLSEAGRNVNIMKETATALSQQIYYDFTLQRFMYYRSLDVSEILPTTKELDTYRSSIPFIDSIYIYNGTTQMFYISSSVILNALQEKQEIADKGIIDLLENYHSYPLFKPIPRKVALPGSQPSSVYTFINYDTLSKGKSVSSAVIINFSETWIRGALTNSNNPLSDTFILDENGHLASNSNHYQITSAYPDEKWFKTLKSNPNEPGYSIHSVNGVKSLVTYSASDSLGWRYIRITPFETITAKISHMKSTTINIGASIILISFFILLALSRKLYKPIDKLELSLTRLENDKRDNFKTIKLEFLRNFMVSKEIHPGLIEKQFLNFGIQLNLKERYCLILLKLDNYYALNEQYSSRDRGLINYAIANIASELCSELYQSEAVEMTDDRIFIIINIPEDMASPLEESLITRLKLIQSSVTSYLNVSISITISDIEDNIGQIASSYRQVMEASLYRLYNGRECIISANEVLNFPAIEYVYPIQKEKQLVENLMVGKMDEALTIYNEIIHETIKYPITVINLAASRLIFMLHNVIKTISISTQTDVHSLFITLNKAETIEEIHADFYQLFEEISLGIDDKKSNKHDDLIQQINLIIQTEFTDPNLSINSIAQSIDMSPVYIGRLYKQYTLVTIGDSIAEVRINKSKELLLENKLPIASIAEQIGFINSTYFYKVFKKWTGFTPNEYKKNSK